MKNLSELTYVNRAKLLHQLRPDSIQDFLDFTDKWMYHLRVYQKKIAKSWNHKALNFQDCLALAVEVENIIAHHYTELTQSSQLFSVQLFSGRAGILSAYILLAFTHDPYCRDESFKHLAHALFYTSDMESSFKGHFETRLQQLTEDATIYIQDMVIPSKKIRLEDTARRPEEQTPCTVSRLPLAFESITIREIETPNGKDIILHGMVNHPHHLQEITLSLQFLDPPTVLYIADYLAKKEAM